MYPEHHMHAWKCAASDQSKQAITSITKLVILASRGQLHVSVAPVFCSASLSILKKLKVDVHPITVGEDLRRLVAKRIAKQTQTELTDLLVAKQTQTELTLLNNLV